VGQPALTDLDVAAAARLAETPLVDLGAGEGGSLATAQRTFGVSGMGVERLPHLAARARERGLDVIEGDLFDVTPAKAPKVRFVVFDNVLEHLPDADAVEHAVHQGCSLASEVVHIRHPSFEDMPYLADLGFKQYWTDWPGVHTAPVAVHELVGMGARAGVHRAVVVPVRRAIDSMDPTILPVDAPPGQTRTDRAGYGVYDEERHGPKSRVPFDRPIYFAYDIFLIVRAGLPTIQYRADPETSAARAVVTWHEASSRARLVRPARRAVGRVVRPMRRRLRRRR
jgi:hypothetical protein